MTTQEIKKQALEIIKVKYPEIKLSDFTIRQARGVIAESELKLKLNHN